MKKEKVIGINITEFVCLTDPTIHFTNIFDFAKDGLVTNYYFKYTIEKEEQKKLRKSSRIRKLDLYNKSIYTQLDGVRFKILNVPEGCTTAGKNKKVKVV